MSKLLFIILFYLYIVKINCLNYDRYQIPTSPTGTLKSNTLFKQGDVLYQGSTKFYISNDGSMVLEHDSKQVWNSGRINSNPTPPFNLVLDESVLVVRDQITSVVSFSSTSGLGATQLTLLEPGAYGRQYGLVLLNDKQKMVWGILGPQISLKEYLIPGSFLDINDKNNRQLKGGEFITNGRDYLFMGKDGSILLFMGNPNGDSKGAPSAFRVTTNIYSKNFTYVLNFEPGGTMVVYSTGTTAPFLYRSPTAPSTRYLHLPCADPTYNKGEWAIVARDDSGRVTWGHFSQPSRSLTPNGVFWESKASSFQVLSGRYLDFKLTYPPNTDLRIDYGTIKVIVTGSSYIGNQQLDKYEVRNGHKDYPMIPPYATEIASHIENGQVIVKSFTKSTIFISDIIFQTPSDLKRNSKDVYFVMHNQIPGLFLVDCSPSLNYNVYVDQPGCKFMWSKTYTVLSN